MENVFFSCRNGTFTVHVFVFFEQNIHWVVCFSRSHSNGCSKILKRRSVGSRRSFQVRQSVSQHGPADTVSGCAAVVSAHEARSGTKHSRFGEQPPGKAVLTEDRNAKGVAH